MGKGRDKKRRQARSLARRAEKPSIEGPRLRAIDGQPGLFSDVITGKIVNIQHLRDDADVDGDDDNRLRYVKWK